jgi:ankyrin repeat protein
MPSRELPSRPHLDHLKNEAKALRQAFLRGDAEAIERVRAVLGPRTELKLTEAQRVIAREYGFPTWSRLRTHVEASRGIDDAVTAFLSAVRENDARRALAAFEAEPAIASASLHVAAVLGREAEVRRMLGDDAGAVGSRAGEPPSEPLLWLCYSPLHGESVVRDEGLAACASVLLNAGADPNTRDPEHNVPALFAVTGHHNVPRIARMLLDAGANPTDGESVFHAAERFHEEALELLHRYGVDLNANGDWGNTPLWFLLNYYDIDREQRVRQGLLWLLEHGADPNVPSGRARESALHVAVRRGQSSATVRLLLERGADVRARRADGRTPWILAERGGFDGLRSLLEEAGAEPEPLAPEDALLAVCSRGDDAAARRLATPALVAGLSPEPLDLMTQAARQGRLEVVHACLAAGFPVDTRDEIGATALHHANIAGRAQVVRELLRRGADFRIRDAEHDSTPLGWACFGVDFMPEPDGDYADCVRALLEAGARPGPDERARHEGVRQVLEQHGGAG